MSAEDNRSFGNLIVMCERHASEIDDTWEAYPPDVLREWKKQQVQVHALAAGTTLSDDEANTVRAVSFDMEDLLEALKSVVPFTSRSRSRQEALELASRSCRARTMVRLRSTPAERLAAVMTWMAERTDPVVTVPAGALRVLVAPMGAGKSEEAERWWSHGLTRAWEDPDIEIPLWLNARDITSTLAAAVQEELAGDPVRSCRVVLDNLDTVSPQRADQLLCDARQLVLVWPEVSVLGTTRPGAGNVENDERLPVSPWPERRGLELLRTVVGDNPFRALQTHEARQLLTSPLQVHALASRLHSGGDARISTRELLSELAGTILRRERPHTSAEARRALPRLATGILEGHGPVQADSFAPHDVVWELEQTGLVVHDDGRLSFALPLFEQHFAAQALKDGHASLESAAGPRSFPRWRYAIAFAVATAPSAKAEACMRTLARTNPAAASWVLDEIASTREATDLPSVADTQQPVAGGDEQQVPEVAHRLREATLDWLHGLGPLGSHLAPHEQGELAPWAVHLEHDWLTVAHARPGVLDQDLVVRNDIPTVPSVLAYFHDRRSFPAPTARLACWTRSRGRLRDSLTARMRRRTLPVPSTSPLAGERAWFLARMVMAKGRPAKVGRHIAVSDLRAELAPLMETVQASKRATWQWGGLHTLDSDDVRWLDAHLRTLSADMLSDPRPPADQAQGQPRQFWQTYSPELTRSVTADVMRDALTGYRDLVQLNFPRFGAALGLFSVFPVRAEGFVRMPRDETPDYPATVMYALRPDPAADQHEPPVVDLKIGDETHATVEALWENLRDDRSSQFGPSAAVHQEDAFLPYHDRQATNLAYSWLAKDLQAVGWLKEHLAFHD